MNGNDTFLDVNDAHLRVTSGNVYASAFNLDQIDIVMSSNTASTVNFNNPTKAFNAASNIEVGTANLFVDTTTTRVGVGTASPATTLDVAGDLNVSGNLTIIGTRTTLDTEHLTVKDPIIELGKDNTASPVVDLGLVMTRPSGSSNVGIIFDESAGRLEIGYTQGSASDSTITMDSAPLSVNVNGTISGNGSGLTALNAAATLTTPRTIGGVNFDGSADIVPTTFGAATFDTDTLVVDATNDRVGVGTVSPDRNFHVLGTSRFDGEVEWYKVGERTSHANYGSNRDWYIRSGSTAGKVIIQDGGGNVGIGTTSPKTNFHVGQQLSAANGNTIPAAGLGISADFPSSTHAWFANRVNATGDDYWGLAVGTIYTGSSYLQNLNKNTGTYYDILLQPNGGNVGIGTTSPTAKLHIKSSSGVDGIAIVNPAGGTGGLLNSSAGVRGGILISNAGGGSDATDDWSSQPIIFNGGGTGATNGNLRGGSIWSMWGGSQYGLAFKGASDGDSVPEGGTTPNVFISSDKVGIGTTSPDSSLDVHGIVTADNLDLDGTVIRSGADITLTAGTWAKIADFSSFTTGGYYLISIKWSNSTLVSTGATCIWYGGVTYSTYVVGGTGLYNSTGQENITYNANYHYRTIDPFLFIQDSDASNGSYGKHSIYMKSPQSDVLARSVAVVAYRIS